MMMRGKSDGSAAELLQDLRRLGVVFRIVDGDRLLYSPVAKVPPGCREDIRKHRDELLRLIHPEAYEALSHSKLADRCREVRSWAADHRPDLFEHVGQADQGPTATDLAVFESALRAVVEAFDEAKGEAEKLADAPAELCVVVERVKPSRGRNPRSRARRAHSATGLRDLDVRRDIMGNHAYLRLLLKAVYRNPRTDIPYVIAYAGDHDAPGTRMDGYVVFGDEQGDIPNRLRELPRPFVGGDHAGDLPALVPEGADGRSRPARPGGPQSHGEMQAG